MGFLSRLFGTDDIDTNNIKSVVLLNQTQLFSEEVRSGYTFGGTWGDGRVIRMSETVPAGTEFTFSVTYKDNTKKILKLRSGTTACDKLLQFLYDNDIPEGDAVYAQQSSRTPIIEAEKVDVGKNQLPAGVYIIGRDIPAGTYDFSWVWGNGQLMKFKDETTTFGASTDFEHIGNKESYEKTLVLNVKCVDSEYLRISGNVLVGIAHSKPVQIDL